MPNSDVVKRLKSLLDARNAEEVVVEPANPAAIVRAPVEAASSVFVSVDDLGSVDDLPPVPERLRDFAFRYATEYRKHSSWAKEYNVTVEMIRRWLQRPGVRQYIALTRYEKRFYCMARRVSLENLVYKRLSEWMSLRITDGNAGAVARITEFAYNLLANPSDIAPRAKGVFAQSINIGIDAGNPPPVDPDGEPGPYAMQEMAVASEAELSALRERVERALDVQRRVDRVERDVTESGPTAE